MIWLKSKTSWVTVFADGKTWRNKKGQFHREDGPAIESFNGFNEYYLNGKCLTKQEWKKRLGK